MDLDFVERCLKGIRMQDAEDKKIRHDHFAALFCAQLFDGSEDFDGLRRNARQAVLQAEALIEQLDKPRNYDEPMDE